MELAWSCSRVHPSSHCRVVDGDVVELLLDLRRRDEQASSVVLHHGFLAVVPRANCRESIALALGRLGRGRPLSSMAGVVSAWIVVPRRPEGEAVSWKAEAILRSVSRPPTLFGPLQWAAVLRVGGVGLPVHRRPPEFGSIDPSEVGRTGEDGLDVQASQETSVAMAGCMTTFSYSKPNLRGAEERRSGPFFLVAGRP